MVKFIEGQVVRNENSTIPYTWIRSEQPNKSICIMLPGLGYTTQRPLFHYATSICLNQSIDILHINYQFTKNEYFKKLLESEQDQWMYEDVLAVVEDVLKETEYEKVFLLSKSIGTIPMAMEWKNKNFSNNTVGVWLTPLFKDDNVFQAILNTELPSLVVIGDNDPHYVEDRIVSICENPHVKILVIPNADHSLEVKGDISATLDVIKKVTLRIQEYVQELIYPE